LLIAVLLSRASAVRKTRLTWVNGIGYNIGHMHRDSPMISKIFGGKTVSFCHNPTAMTSEEDMLGYVGDFAQAGSQKLGRITAEVNELVKHLKSAVSEVGKHGRVLHIAHSQGALVTTLAAKQLTPLEMNQIEILAFGGAAALRKTPETPFARCINYYSVNDPILLLVPSAVQALRSGWVYDEDEFCFLAPRSGDPIEDHGLLGPTYAQALGWEGQRFQSEYQSLAFRSTRTLVLFWSTVFHFIWTKALEIRQFLITMVAKTLIWIWSRLLRLYQATAGVMNRQQQQQEEKEAIKAAISSVAGTNKPAK